MPNENRPGVFWRAGRGRLGGVKRFDQSLPVGAGKLDDLRGQMARLGIVEADLEERFILGGGRGGQKVNKTSSCVHLKHLPTGIEIKCQRDRSQAMNRFFARRELCEQLAERIEGEASRRRQQREKVRRQKGRRSRRAKARMLEEKHKQGEKKVRRRRVDPD